MTIKQFAKSRGITPAAVYSRLKANDISVSSLTDEKTGELSASGMSQLQSLYKDSSAYSIKLNQVESSNQYLKEQLDKMIQKAKASDELSHALQIKLDDAKEMIQNLLRQIDVIRKQKESAIDRVKRDNEILQMQLSAATDRVNHLQTEADRWYQLVMRVTTPRIAEPEQSEPETESKGLFGFKKGKKNKKKNKK